MVIDGLNFLTRFNHATYTLAFYKNKVMRSFPCKPQNLERALSYLTKENEQGAEIYFMVNEGNGVLNPSKTACHSTENVCNLSAIFLDAELPNNVDPLPAIYEFCKQFFVAPSLIVQTSPSRYHVYWLLSPSHFIKRNIYRWKQVQSYLHTKLSSDRTMTDLPQILRVPGYTNVKKQAPVTCILDNANNIYSLDDLWQKLLTNFPSISSIKPHTPLEPLKEVYQVPEGERHEELLRRVRKLYSIPLLTDEDIRCWTNGFIHLHIKDNKDFLNGSRKQEINRILASAKSYAEQEARQQQQAQITKIIEKTAKNPFELDPDFFYQAPGIVGDITRYIVDVSDYPIPSHAFAAAVSLVGLTKARYIQGYKQLPPLSYFLCLAPAGSGKTSIQHIFKSILSQLQLSHLFEDGIASAQGLIHFLIQSNGLGIILYDEVKELFQTIQHKNAASYELKISTELTKLYTAYSTRYIPASTKSHKGKKLHLDKPLFSFIGYGHHTLIDKIFTKDNVIEGLLPRFIVLNVNKRTEKIPLYKNVPTHLLDELRHYVTKSCLVVESQANKCDVPIQLDPQIEVVSHSVDSQIIYNQFSKDLVGHYNQAVADKNALEALFSRGLEQSMRLSLAMSKNSQIDAPTMQFCVDLVKQQTNWFYQEFNESVNQTDFSKNIDKLYEKILELCSESSDYTISKRDLQNRTSRWFTAKGQFHTHVQELIERGKIEEIQLRKPSGKIESRLKIEAELT